MPSPPVRVVVLLPYNRPEQPLEDPVPVEWNPEKENMLWEVIARSRATESGGTDWKGLASHLQVPLPYLLYRAQTRYEEDLRGLQDIRGTLNPTITQGIQEDPVKIGDRPTPIRRTSVRMGSMSKLSSSVRLTTPLGVRTRLNSLGNRSPRRLTKPLSSSTLTLKRRAPLRPASPSSCGSGSDSDEEADKAEEEERKLEEQDALDRKLKNLQLAMTTNAIGLVREPSLEGKGKEPDRGRSGLALSRLSLQGSIQRRASSTASESVSATTSPQGSITSIPSPAGDSQPHSPTSRHLSPAKSSSPPALSPGRARGHPHMRYGPLVGRTHASDKGSNHGSSASSFSDISETSVSASALESALLSNIRGNGSRISAFARSHFGGRAGGGPPS